MLNEFRGTGSSEVVKSLIGQAEIVGLDSKCKGRLLKGFTQGREMITFTFQEYCCLLAGNWTRMETEKPLEVHGRARGER